MNKFGKAIVKLRVPILIISILLLIPAAIGFLKTRVNYDVLSYLPKDIETMKGQDILADDFGTGAFSLCLVEGMEIQRIFFGYNFVNPAFSIHQKQLHGTGS